MTISSVVKYNLQL